MTTPAPGCPFDRIGIVGLGLIGGSAALAARAAWPHVRLTGVDTPAVLDAAMRAGTIDETRPSVRDLDDVDLIILATPMPDVLDAIRDLAAVTPRGVVTDVASTKRGVMDAARVTGLHRFVGGHPMAGAAQGGLANARADLFRDRPWVVVPGWDEAASAVADIERFVEGLGARPEIRAAAAHDRIVARLSHLPQLMAVALMNVAGRTCTDEDLAIAGPGFSDMTRLAASPGELWGTILSSNAGEVSDAARAVAAELAAMAERAIAGDEASARASFAEANQHRERVERVVTR